MGQTSIEWTDHTINPIRARIADAAHAGATKGGYGSGVGHYCEKVSAGCAHCYSSQTQPRFGMPEFPGQTGNADVEPFFDDSRLLEVLRRKAPTKFFWCDMSDLFGKWVRDEWLDKCFAVMALTPQHTHQVLTKRIERAEEYLSSKDSPLDKDRWDIVSEWAVRIGKIVWDDRGSDEVNYYSVAGGTKGKDFSNRRRPPAWPLPNVWLGCSVENQQTADERSDHLRRCPAAVRFYSCEPLLGDIALNLDGISWVICGGESGPHARPMNPAWARGIRDQCKMAESRRNRTAFFFKQWGEHDDHGRRVGKHAAGRLLDGRTWDEFPGGAM